MILLKNHRFFIYFIEFSARLRANEPNLPICPGCTKIQPKLCEKFHLAIFLIVWYYILVKYFFVSVSKLALAWFPFPYLTYLLYHTTGILSRLFLNIFKNFLFPFSVLALVRFPFPCPLDKYIIPYFWENCKMECCTKFRLIFCATCTNR